jgi:hypothetical protein
LLWLAVACSACAWSASACNLYNSILLGEAEGDDGSDTGGASSGGRAAGGAGGTTGTGGRFGTGGRCGTGGAGGAAGAAALQLDDETAAAPAEEQAN